MTAQNLEQLLQESGGPVELLRSRGHYPYSREKYGDIPFEYTNWREEQQAWTESVTLADQSEHMNDLFVEGPDALEVFSDLGINDFRDFEPGKAKQFVTCNPDGYFVGDGILFHLEENKLDLVGLSGINWVRYNIENGDYDVSVELDGNRMYRDGTPKFFRYQVQGPHAIKVMKEAIDGSLPEIAFFNFAELSIAGNQVNALRHGMVNEPGFELWGPWEAGDAVKETILEVGEDYDLRQVGTNAYSSSAVLTSWIVRAVPAVFSDGMEAYREWLDTDTREAQFAIGGSFKSDDIADYYLTPMEMGFSRFIDFDHDFIGKEALQEKIDEPHREKVTLIWDDEDVGDVYASLFREGKPYKYMELPRPLYGYAMYDQVLKDGESAGISTRPSYVFPYRSMMSIGVVDPELSEPGTEVTVVWGEEGSNKPSVEDHVEKEIRATVTTAPPHEDRRKTGKYSAD